MPQIQEHAKNIPKGQGKANNLTEILCFSADVCQRVIAYKVVHVQICFKSF